MNHDLYNETTSSLDSSISSLNGCSSKVKDPLKQLIAFNLGKSLEQTQSELLKGALNKILNIRERNLCTVGLSACPGSEVEEALLGLLKEKLHLTQTLSALKTLGEIGTEKSLKELGNLKLSGSKSTIRQIQFAKLLIMSRHQLTGAESLLKELTESQGRGHSFESVPLKLDLLDSKDTHQHATQMQGHRYGIVLSKKLGFSIDAGIQKFSFLVNSTLDNPAEWGKSLVKQQILGLIAKQSTMGNRIYMKYLALSTPESDHTLISVFRSNGQLLLKARLANGTGIFYLTNVGKGPTNNKNEHQLGDGNSIILDLTYIRTSKKHQAVQDIA